MPLPIARAPQAARQAQNPNNPSGQIAERIVYSPEVHGDANAFRNSGQFSTFTTQYKAEIKQLNDLVDEHVPDSVKAHQLKRNLASFEDHLFSSADHFSTKSGMMFKGARDHIQQITQRLALPEMSALDKQTGLERALGEIDKCADGVLSNLQSANLHLKCAEEGKMGACKKNIHEQLEAHAQAFAQKNHGGEENFAGNEVHFTNGYMDRAIKDHLNQLPASGDHLGATLERSDTRNLLPAFSDQVPSSITPGSTITGLADEHYQAFSEVLSEHTQSSNKVLSYKDMTPDLIAALDDKVMTPLKPLLTDEQRQSVSVMHLGEDLDGESFSFESAKEKIRELIATSMKDGLVEFAWPKLSEQAEKIADIRGGRSIHHEQGVVFSVKSSGSEQPRSPRIEDLRSLELASWPTPLMSDLAQQAIGAATSVKELDDFVSQHLDPSNNTAFQSNRRHKGLQSKLTQAVQVKVATDLNIEAEVTLQISQARSVREIESLPLLIEMSTQGKVAYVNKAHELGMPPAGTVESYLCDMDVLSGAPVAQIVRAFSPGKLLERLHQAALEGHGKGVAKLISVPTVDVNYQIQGTTPLIRACGGGHKAVVEKLLNHPDIKVNRASDNGLTALMIASHDGHEAVVEKLLEHQGVDVNQPDIGGVTALIRASSRGHEAVVVKLLNHPDIEVNRPDNIGITALMIASFGGDAAVVEKLLKHQGIEVVDVNQSDQSDMTALNMACVIGSAAVVETLLKHQHIDVNHPSNIGVTPLMSAIQLSNVAVLEQLLEHPSIEVNKSDDVYNMTVLHHVCQTGKMAALEKLIEHKDIDINRPADHGITALGFASINGCVDVVEKLLTCEGIEINQPDDNGTTPLSFASLSGYSEIVEKLLDCDGIEVNRADNNGSTPLILACSNGHAEVVEKLLGCKDIDVNKPDNDGLMPLRYAYQSGNAEVVALLDRFIESKMPEQS